MGIGRQARARLSGAGRTATVLLATLCLAACGTIARPDPVALRLVPGELTTAPDPRIRADDEAALTALMESFAARMSTADGRLDILALSGGGANGAFGAGVLVGWSESGTRPRFDIVTGVCTGALAAPFAFLGPDRDDELRAAYAEGGTEGLLGWRSLRAFAAPSLFSPDALRRLVEQAVTPDLLREIAAQHASGRRLLVVTTNLDSQETVIWDMGVLATQGDAQALALFRQVLLASASIPGLFPPAMIAGVTDGRVVEEMHVDGGVNTPFLGVPESLLLWTRPDTARGSSALYVLVNGQVDRDYRVTRGRLPAILARSYDSMSKASLRTHLAANATFAERNGIVLRVAAIPVEVEASSLDFDQDSMAALFELGRGRGATGDAWSRIDSGATAPAPADAEPAPTNPGANPVDPQ